ncbi:MAG: hypothetical protein PHE41_02090 [Eubacteriales bacterium]|nr:hypothetical protein [Eubacteriales bacterium]
MSASGRAPKKGLSKSTKWFFNVSPSRTLKNDPLLEGDNLPFLTVNQSDSVEEGDTVTVVGNPTGIALSIQALDSSFL